MSGVFGAARPQDVGKSYEALSERLGTRDVWNVTITTKVVRLDEHRIAYQYHETFVAIYSDDGTVVLHDGGKLTASTLIRLNDVLPYLVIQEKGIWWMVVNGKRYRYYDGMTICTRSNTVLDYDDQQEEFYRLNAYNKAMRKRIKNYVSGLTAVVLMKLLHDFDCAPSVDSCFDCLAERRSTIETAKEATYEKEHLLVHMEKQHYSLTLLENALRYCGYSNPRDYLRYQRSHPQDHVQRAFEKFLKRQLLERVVTR